MPTLRKRKPSALTVEAIVQYALSYVNSAVDATAGENLHPGVRSHLIAAETQLLAAEKCVRLGVQKAA